jgi:uncharacterized protein (DUF169 family)
LTLQLRPNLTPKVTERITVECQYRYLLFRTSPLAVKMLVDEKEVPEDAVRPRRDHGFHLSQCQAFAMSCRQRLTVAMLKEDNWCWAPLIGFGLVDSQAAEKIEATRNQVKILPRFEYGKYLGIVSAPLRTVSFEPDVVLIYSNTAQLRSMLLAIKYKEGVLVSSQFDPINSCVYAVVQVILTGQWLVNVPCAGEQRLAEFRLSGAPPPHFTSGSLQGPDGFYQLRL